MFSCLRCNVEAFCHKQDLLMRGAATFVDRGRRRHISAIALYSIPSKYLQHVTLQQ